ncbi:MAG: hypothetical protein ACRDVL_11740 [Acidimicrobiia bacterium]
MSVSAPRTADAAGSRLLIWLILSLLPLTLIAAIVIAVRASFAGLLTPWMITFISFGLTGALIVLRRPGHPLGWLLFSLGLFTNVGVFGLALASGLVGEGRMAAAGWADAAGNSLLTGVILMIPAILILFPDGRPPSRRWRWFLSVVFLTALLGSAAALLNGGWGGDIEQAILVSPLRARTAPLGDLISQIFFVGLAISMIGAAISVLLRFRRSREHERRQIKWLAVAGFVVVVSMSVVGFDTQETWEIAVVSAAFSLIPVAITLAILRYRLYEIDRLLARTVSYALVVGLLAAVFFGLVTLLAGVLSPDQPLVVAASTLAVFALFNPLRKRIQEWVDKRFNRSRYDAERVIETFTGTLRDRVDPDGVVDGWVGVVSETMHPSKVGAWVRE